jgi:hypothetical protein
MWSPTSIVYVSSWGGAWLCAGTNLALISALETVSIHRLSHVRSVSGRALPCQQFTFPSQPSACWVSGTHKPLRRSDDLVLFYKLGGKRDLDQLRRRCQDQTIQTRNRSLAQTLTERTGPSDNKENACRILISRILFCGSNHDGLCTGVSVHQCLHFAVCMPSFFYHFGNNIF